MWEGVKAIFWFACALFLIACNHSGFRKKFLGMVFPTYIVDRIELPELLTARSVERGGVEDLSDGVGNRR